MARDEVELVLSGALFGGDPRGFIDFLGLHGRPLGNNRWAVWPSNDKDFVSHHGLADDTEFVNRFDHLTHLPMNNTHLDDPAVIARFAELDRQLTERMAGPDIAAAFGSVNRTYSMLQPDQLMLASRHACFLEHSRWSQLANFISNLVHISSSWRPPYPASSIARSCSLRSRSGRDGTSPASE
jgi:hypothetical protein